MSRHWFEVMLAVALLIAEQAMSRLLPVDWPASLSWIIAASALALFLVGVWGLWRDSRGQGSAAFVADLHPKDLAKYLCDDAEWCERFDDKLSWFQDTKMALRDELRQGRRLRAQGRPSGKWGDGRFRHPSDFIEREFWIQGDLNWMRIINKDYVGDIDAYDPGYGEQPKRQLDDVMFCRREVEAIWPRRSWLRRLLKPTRFEPFERPNYGPPPWHHEQPPPMIPLKEAATRAYEETKNNLSGKFAEWDNEPDGIITWYCWALWQRLTLRGNRPPARTPEVILWENKNRYSFEIEDGTLLLTERYGKTYFENLHVDASELENAIEEIKALG